MAPLVPVDRRPGDRPGSHGGPAFYAAQARRALGLSSEVRALGTRVPRPVFAAAVAVAVCAAAVLVRPQRLGYPVGVVLDVVLAGLTGATLVAHARLVCPSEVRPGVAAAFLPGAALLSLALVLAGTDDLVVDVVAAAVAAAVIAGVPYIETLEIAARASPVLRVGRDAAAVLTAVPACVAAGSSLPGPARLVLVTVVTAALGADAGRHLAPWRVALVVPAAVGAAVAGAAAVAATPLAQGPGAVAVLLAWHGSRGGLAHLLQPGPSRMAAVLEHAGFVAVAAAVLVLGR